MNQNIHLAQQKSSKNLVILYAFKTTHGVYQRKVKAQNASGPTKKKPNNLVLPDEPKHSSGLTKKL